MSVRNVIRRMAKKAIPDKLFASLTGDLYTEELEKAKKDIFTNKSLLEKYGQEIAYLKKEGGLVIFPYSFQEKYDARKIDVLLDKEIGLRYVIHDHKRLYFPRAWEEKRIRNYYNGLLIEQDIESPHRYFTDKFKVEKGDVFVDVGCAEAMSSLECVDTADEIYLFECSEEWKEALNATFGGRCGNKVHIIPKYVRNYSDEESITLDEALKESFGKNFLIKLDLNGYEWDVLSGSPNFLNTQKIRCLGCTYHRQQDESILLPNLQKAGFECEFSTGYMLFLFSELKYPYFRRGLIRANNYDIIDEKKNVVGI